MLDPLVCCWQSRIRPQVVSPPAIRCERASKQRPQAMPQVATKKNQSTRKEWAILLRSRCMYYRASVTSWPRSGCLCHRAERPSGLTKKHLGAPEISSKNGRRFVAGKWAQNLGHTPGFSFKFGQGPVFGHEIVAKKWAQNPDRVFVKKITSRREL